MDFAFGLFAAGDGEDFLKNFAAGGFEGLAVEDFAGVDVHVVDHPLVHRRVAGDFDAGGWLEADATAAAGGEADDVAAAGHEAGDAGGVEAGGVHDDEPLGGDRLGVLVDLGHRGGAGFGDRAEGLFGDGGEATFLVADGGIVVELHAVEAGVPDPPFDPLDELVRDGRRAGSPREQVLGSVDFRRFRQDRRAASGNEHVRRNAESRIAGDAAVAVGAAAVGAEDDLAGGNRHTLHVIGPRQ